MHTPHRTSATLLTAFAASLLFAPALFAETAASGIFINGVELDQQQVAMLYQTTGVSLLPGHYLIQDGCVSHLESGQSQCAPQANQYDDGANEYSGGVYGDGTDGYAYGGDAYDYGGGAYNQGGDSYEYGGAGGGYGYSNDDGGWFHRGGDYSGGYSVGSDNSGCIYTPDWSNC
jgi:hypothetical protein